MKKQIRRKVISADYCRGSGGAFWELFLECGHVAGSGGYSKYPKTTICYECTKEANKRLLKYAQTQPK